MRFLISYVNVLAVASIKDADLRHPKNYEGANATRTVTSFQEQLDDSVEAIIGLMSGGGPQAIVARFRDRFAANSRLSSK
jgi:hypothetical protein